MTEFFRGNVFRAYFLLVISCLCSTKEYIFTDSSGIIGSPISHENGQFTYQVTPEPDVTIRIQSEKLNLSKRVHGMGCDKNYITVAQEWFGYISPRYCDEDEIDELFDFGPIYIKYTKVTDSRAYFNISYKACSYISFDPAGTFVNEEEFNRSFVWCYFKINITTSLIVTLFGDWCYGWIIYGPDDSLLWIKPDCVTSAESFFIRNGPVIMYGRHMAYGKKLIAKYTTVSEDYLSQEYTAPEGKFEPLLFYNKYANFANYTFTIRSDYGGKVLVYFQNIDIGGCNDVIHVNGVVLCQNNASTVIISDEVAKVSFDTDDYKSRTGFEGYWTTCGGTFRNQFGSIRQPMLNAKSHYILLKSNFSCSYDVEIQNAENIFLKIENMSSYVIDIHEKGEEVTNGVYRGNQLIFEYKADNGLPLPFEAFYLGCPRIFTNEAGNFSLDSPWNKLIPVGFNCSFIITKTTNKVLILNVNIQYENDSMVNVSDKSSDIVQIEFHDENNMGIKTRITGVGNITSYGECIITYIAGDGAKLKFHASYISQSDRDGGKELEESKNMTFWLVLAVVLVALLLML